MKTDCCEMESGYAGYFAAVFLNMIKEELIIWQQEDLSFILLHWKDL